MGIFSFVKMECYFHARNKVIFTCEVISHVSARKFPWYFTGVYIISIGNRMNASAFRDLWARVMF